MELGRSKRCNDWGKSQVVYLSFTLFDSGIRWRHFSQAKVKVLLHKPRTKAIPPIHLNLYDE